MVARSFAGAAILLLFGLLIGGTALVFFILGAVLVLALGLGVKN